MTKFEKIAIERRYQGDTYKEITQLLNKMGLKISEGVVRQWFMTDGRLYMDYLDYEAKQNDWTEENARKEYKRLSRYTSKVQTSLLKQAIKHKDFRLAWDIIKDINDRAGLVVIKKTESTITDERGEMTDEQFFKRLEELQIDRNTGLRIGKAEEAEEEVLPN